MGQPFAGSDSNCTTSSATPHRSGRPVLPDLQHFRDYVLALGYLSAPVVVVDAGTHWSGYRDDRLAELVAASAA